MRSDKYIYWIILFILVVTPLLFFTDLTRNPYYTQITLLNMALIAAVLVVCISSLINGSYRWKKTPLDLSLLLFLIIVSVSIIWSWLIHPLFRYSIYSESVKRWIYLVVNCYVAYYLAVLFINDSNRKKYLDIALAVGAVAAAYGIMQYFRIEIIWPKVLTPFGVRSVSTFGNPNFLSSFLVILIPVSLHYLFSSETSWKLKSGDILTLICGILLVLYVYTTRDNRDASVDRVIGILAACGVIASAMKLSLGKTWYCLFFVLLIGSLLATMTRSSWLGGIVCIGVYVIGIVITGKIDKKVFGIVAVILVLMVLFWPRSSGKGYSPTVVERFLEAKEVTRGLYAPLHQRLLIWRCALSMTEQFPVLGVGWGNFELFYPLYQGRHMIGTFFRRFRTHANNTHNEVLEILSQVGISGFGIYILFIAAMFFALWKNKEYLMSRYGLLPLALLAGALGMWVDNLLNVSLHFAVPGFLHWWQLGILMGMVSPHSIHIPLRSKTSRAIGAGVAVYCCLLIVRAVMFQIAEVHFFKGFKLSKRNQLKPAVVELEAARKFHRLEVNNNYELGNCYARLHNHKKAFFAYEEAMKANAGYDEIYYNMAAVYLQIKDKKNALKLYERAISINPLTIESYLALGNLYLENLEEHGEKLLALYKQGLQFYPDHKDIWNNLGYVYTKGGQHEMALDAYARSLSIDPGFTLARQNLQVALKALGKTSHPLLEIENKLREIDGFINRNDYTKALTMIEGLQEAHPDDSRVLIYLGNIQFSMGEYDKAADIFKNIARKDTNQVTVLNNLAAVYIKQKKFKEALEQYKTVLTIDAGNALARENVQKLEQTGIK